MPHGVRVSREVRRGFASALRAGLSPSEAAVAVGASDSAGRRWIINAGGVMERRATSSGFRLSLADRESIENGCRAGLSFAVIAAVIGKAPSTISREVGGRTGRATYRADLAQLRAEDQARRPQQTKLEANAALCERVAAGLEALLSPEQIAGQLRREFPQDPEMQVHHETIYRELFVQGRGALREELKKCLRSGRARRVTRAEARQRRSEGRERVKNSV